MDGLFETSSTCKTHFFRLLLFSVILIVAVLPLSIESVYRPASTGLHPYSWSETHSDWDPLMLPTFGKLAQWDGIVSIICGYLAFLCFGVGKDTIGMYKEWLRYIGLGKHFPALLPASRKSSYATSTWNSAKRMLSRTSAVTKSRSESW
jgi:Pheromone A receptor